jgi:hypothetical protein
MDEAGTCQLLANGNGVDVVKPLEKRPPGAQRGGRTEMPAHSTAVSDAASVSVAGERGTSQPPGHLLFELHEAT